MILAGKSPFFQKNVIFALHYTSRGWEAKKKFFENRPLGGARELKMCANDCSPQKTPLTIFGMYTQKIFIRKKFSA